MEQDRVYMLDKLDDLAEIAIKGRDTGNLYCPQCSKIMRMSIKPHGMTKVSRPSFLSGPPKFADLIIPSLYLIRCLQCDTEFTALIYNGTSGVSLVILPTCNGGLRTHHTPEGVAYYLDQAYRSQSVGANSAATAMYRAALDNLLFERGYKHRMLGPKINALQADIDSNKAPKWAMDLDIKLLAFLKNLGDGAIHPNDGDITKQSELDYQLLVQIQEAFQVLLHLVYEVTHEKQARMNMFEAKVQEFKK